MGRGVDLSVRSTHRSVLRARALGVDSSVRVSLQAYKKRVASRREAHIAHFPKMQCDNNHSFLRIPVLQ